MFARAQIHHRQAEDHRVAMRVARQLHETRARLQDGIVRRFVARRSKTRDAHPDQIGFDRAQRFVINAELFIRIGALIRGEDVNRRFADQAMQDAPPSFVEQVQGDGFLPQIVRQEVGVHSRLEACLGVRVAQHLRTHPTVRVAARRRLKADDPHPIHDQFQGHIRKRRRLFEREDSERVEGIHIIDSPSP